MDVLVKCSNETHNPFFQGSESNDTFTIDKGCHGYPILNTDMTGADTFYLTLDVDPYNKTPHNFREGGGTPIIENFSIKDDKIILPPQVALLLLVLYIFLVIVRHHIATYLHCSSLVNSRQQTYNITYHKIAWHNMGLKSDFFQRFWWSEQFPGEKRFRSIRVLLQELLPGPRSWIFVFCCF